MRLAPLLCLLPALATAQDIPSLQRPGVALPITEAIPVLRTRIGGPGGPFAAAQLALKGRAGIETLAAIANDPDPLRRLDAAFGLGLVDTEEADFEAARFLGDPDLRVADEAEHGLRLAGRRAVGALIRAARIHPERAADRAAELLMGLGEGVQTLRLVQDSKANGRGGAVRALDISFDKGLPIFEAAAHDRRPNVRFEAARRIVFGPRSPGRTAALDRLSGDPDEGVRLAVVRAMDEDPGSSLDAAYERAQQYGHPGSRRVFARMVANNLYDPARLAAATAILARLANDRSSTVGDAAIEELDQFLEDRLGSVGYGSSGPDEGEDVPWDRLSSTTVVLLRRAAVRRLTGPLAFKASVVLARLHDPRGYSVLAQAAFDRKEGDMIATLALGELRDRRATSRLLARVRAEPGDMVAFDALGRLGDPAAIPALLAFVRRADTVQNASVSAAYALAAIGDRAAVPHLIEIIRADPSLGTNYFVPLARLGGPDAGHFLLDRLERGPEDRIQYATLALGEMRDPTVVAELKRLAAGQGPRAMRAQEALSTIDYRASRRGKTP